MINLKLFTQLQGNNTASLVLRPGAAGTVDFYIIAATVNYSIVTAGVCEGELPQRAGISFDVVLSSLSPLLDKNYDFRLSYVDGILRFEEAKGRFTLEPLCVEHIADYALNIVQKYRDMVNTINTVSQVSGRIAEVKDEISKLESRISYNEQYGVSPVPSENPWSESGDPEVVTKQLEADNRNLKKYQDELSALEQRAKNMSRVDLGAMRRIVNIAAKNNTVVSMCDDYAIVQLRDAFAIQKGSCGTRAVQGKLFQRLLAEEHGVFFEQDGELIFTTTAGDGRDKSTTMVLVHPFLPSNTVDKTVVTKGTTQEKYTLNLKGMMRTLSAVQSKFKTMEFNMGAAQLVMSNDQGEKFIYKFDVEDANTLELKKLMRGDTSANVVMSCIEIPQTVQRILPFMQDKFTIYVKQKKIVLESTGLFIVFAR